MIAENPRVEIETAVRESPGRFHRHRGPVTCVAGIPGTRSAVTSGYDAAVGIVDLERGEIELLGYHDHLVNRIVVSPDGTRAASCSSDYTVCLWDLNLRKPERVLRGHCDDVEDFAFLDAQTGVSASRDHRIFIWDLATGAVVRVIDEHEKDVLSVVCSGGQIFSAGDDMTLRQWDAATGRLLRKWGPFEQETDTCAIDPLHHRVVLGADDGCIRVFDSRSGEPIREIPAHRSGIKKVAVSPVTGAILSAAYDQRLLVWNAETFELETELARSPATWERSLNWSPDGRQILAGTFDGTVLVWDAATGAPLAEIGGEQDSLPGNACLNDVAAGADGELAVVSDDGFVRLARLTPTAAEWTARVEPASGRRLMNAVTADPARRRVLTGAHDHKLHLFEHRPGGLENEVAVPLGSGPINCIRVAHHPGYEGEAFVACYSSAIVRVGTDGVVRGKIEVHEGAVKALRLHPEKPLGVSCGADGLLLSWSFDGRLLERFHGHMAIVDDVDIDPTGELVASVSRDFTLKVYDLESGKMTASIPLGHQSPKSMCFWDKDTVLVGNYWGWVLRADLSTGEVTRSRIAGNGLSAVARAGEHAVVTSYDGAVYLVRPEDLTVAGYLRAMHQRVTGETVNGRA
jgi:WD40 repeat protein